MLMVKWSQMFTVICKKRSGGNFLQLCSKKVLGTCYNDNLKIASPEDIIVNFDLIKNSQKEILLLDKEKKDMLIKRWRRNTQEEIQL